MYDLNSLEALLDALPLVLLPPVALGLWWHWYRRRRAEQALSWAGARAAALEQALAATPDGWFGWFHGAAVRDDEAAQAPDPLSGGLCSRRLAVLLSLYSGRAATFAEVLDRFPVADGDALRAAAGHLRATGEGFDLVLSQDGPDDEPRRLRATGIRAVADDGTPLADLIWMRDVTAEEAALGTLSQRTEALESEADSLRAVLDALPVPVWLRDDGLRITRANRAFLDAVEAATEDEVRAGDRELGAGVAAREMRALASAARAAGAPRSASFHVVLHGDRRRIEVTEVPAGGESGERVTVGIALDMSRLESLRATLEQEVSSHATVLEKLGTAIAIFGPDTRLRFCNTAFTKRWRLDREWVDEEPTYAEFLEAVRARRLLPEVADYPAFREQELARFKSLLEPVEDLLHLPDGQTLRRVLAPHPLGGLLATYEDVTDRLALEARLNQLDAIQRETIDHLHEAVAVFGPDGRLRLYNSGFRDLWGLRDEDLAGAPHLTDVADTVQSALAGARAWEDMRTQLAAGPQERGVRRARIEREDGRTLDAVGVPLPDGGVLFTYLDVTDAARVEKALRDRAAALSEADRLKNEFMANVSYEMRTPLTSILGFAEILGDEYYGPLNPRQREYARGIVDTAQTLTALLDDIGDLVMLKAGDVTLERTAVDVHAVLAAVLALTREAVRRRELTLNFDCPPDIGRIMADERRLKQILYHLVINAVKFTPPGGQIILAAQTEGKEAVFTVADTGVGIPESEQGKVFDSFQRRDVAGSGHRGAGLGLPLVRRLVDLHGGTVELVSVPAEGTTVTVRLPVDGGTGEGATRPAEAAGAGLVGGGAA